MKNKYMKIRAYKILKTTDLAIKNVKYLFYGLTHHIQKKRKLRG